MFGTILKTTNSSFQKGTTFCRSIYVKKVMELLAIIFEQPSYYHLFCCNRTCHCVYMVSVTWASRYIMSVSRYHTRYQSRSMMYTHGLIPRDFAKSAEAVQIGSVLFTQIKIFTDWRTSLNLKMLIFDSLISTIHHHRLIASHNMDVLLFM